MEGKNKEVGKKNILRDEGQKEQGAKVSVGEGVVWKARRQHLSIFLLFFCLWSFSFLSPPSYSSLAPDKTDGDW